MIFKGTFNKNKTVKNGSMTLKPVVSFSNLSGEANAIVCARLNGDGTIFDYVVGKNYQFTDASHLTWCFGSYNLTKQQAEKIAENWI